MADRPCRPMLAEGVVCPRIGTNDMNEVIGRTSSAPIVPVPRTPIAVRVATMADLPFMDGLQKRFNRALGYFPTKQFEGYIETGGVLVAESVGSRQRAAGSEEEAADGASSTHPLPTAYCPLPTPLGYIISRDRYLKRDELGVIYQLCVAPGDQRKLIGAALAKAVFERSAYGCRLYCCWCAQDLAANHFWESLGFVPIAFRAGGRKTLRRGSGQARVHIFWQRRIVEGDTGERTPWWYPFQTNSGAIREDRLVFPIPPGTHWRDIRPLEVTAVAVPAAQSTRRQLPRAKQEPSTRKKDPNNRGATGNASRTIISASGLRFAAPACPERTRRESAKEKPTRARAAKARAKACPERSRRIDPQLAAKARELRDRCMEHVNDHRIPAPRGKYDVSRPLPAPRAEDAAPRLLLEAA